MYTEKKEGKRCALLCSAPFPSSLLFLSSVSGRDLVLLPFWIHSTCVTAYIKQVLYILGIYNYIFYMYSFAEFCCCLSTTVSCPASQP